MKVMERYANDTDRQASNIVYVLGRQNPNGQGTREAPLEGVHQMREWAFYMDKGRKAAPRAFGLRELVERLKKGEELTAGGYTYRIKDKFLKRFEARGRNNREG